MFTHDDGDYDGREHFTHSRGTWHIHQTGGGLEVLESLRLEFSLNSSVAYCGFLMTAAKPAQGSYFLSGRRALPVKMGRFELREIMLCQTLQFVLVL